MGVPLEEFLNCSPAVEEMQNFTGERGGADTRAARVVLQYELVSPPIANQMRRATIEILHSDSQLLAGLIST